MHILSHLNIQLYPSPAAEGQRPRSERGGTAVPVLPACPGPAVGGWAAQGAAAQAGGGAAGVAVGQALACDSAAAKSDVLLWAS